MTIQTWGQAITDSLVDLWVRFINFVPSLVGAILVFFIGWFVAIALAKFVMQALRALKVDSALDNAGLRNILDRANIKGTVSGFFGEVVKWFLLIVFLVAASEILGLTQIGIFLNKVLFYIPQLVIAVVILLVAVLFSRFVGNVVQASVKAAHLNHGSFLSTVAKWSIMIFAILAALEQLGVAPAMVGTLFTGIIALLAIAGGLAFGLGGKDAASQFLNKLRDDIKENHNS